LGVLLPNSTAVGDSPFDLLGGLGTGETLHMSQQEKSPWFEILCASALLNTAKTHTHTYVYNETHTRTLTHTYTHTHTHTYIHIHSCIYISMCMYVCVRMRACVCVHVSIDR